MRSNGGLAYCPFGKWTTASRKREEKGQKKHLLNSSFGCNFVIWDKCLVFPWRRICLLQSLPLGDNRCFSPFELRWGVYRCISVNASVLKGLHRFVDPDKQAFRKLIVAPCSRTPYSEARPSVAQTLSSHFAAVAVPTASSSHSHPLE